ncbi:MAG: hypothetical protein AB1656_24635 [Candidatus Omnitrophota bacterium]
MQDDVVQAHCFAQIVHKEKNGRVYMNVVRCYPNNDPGFMTLGKGRD